MLEDLMLNALILHVEYCGTEGLLLTCFSPVATVA